MQKYWILQFVAEVSFQWLATLYIVVLSGDLYRDMYRIVAVPYRFTPINFFTKTVWIYGNTG